MKRFLLLSLLVGAGLLGSTPAQAQSVTTVNYPVGYKIDKVGYPSALVPRGRDGIFYYLEYWPVVKEMGRMQEGWYLQCIQPKQDDQGEFFAELWAERVAYREQPSFQHTDLLNLNESLALIGESNDKRRATHVQFYRYGGETIGPLQTVTPLSYKVEDYQQFIVKSGDGARFLWMGWDPNEAAKKRTYHATLFGDDSRLDWRVDFRLPDNEAGYIVKDATVDRRGNLFLLCVAEANATKVTNPALKPRIVRYDAQTTDRSIKELDFAGSPHIMDLHTTQNDELYLACVLGPAAGAASFPNGIESLEEPVQWGQVHLRRYDLNRRDPLVNLDSTWALPDTLIQRYQDGANFSSGRFFETQDQLFWYLEEDFVQKKTVGTVYLAKDVLTVGFKIPSGQFQWVNVLEKSQRDYSPALLSVVPAISESFFSYVYLSEIGPSGRLMMHSINRSAGGALQRPMLKNDQGAYNFIPSRSIQLPQTGRVLMLGTGRPNQDEYNILQIKYVP